MDVELICNIVFGVSVGLIVLFAVIGAVKGVWKATFAMFIQLAMMVVAIFVSPVLGKSIGSIDLSRLKLSPFQVNGTTVQVTSVRQTICDALTASGVINPVQGQTIYQAALAVTDIVLALACYLVLCLFSILFSWLLASLLYHTLFKWFIPKRLREKHPVHPLGALAGAVMGVCASTLAIAPLSSLVDFTQDNRAAVQNLEDRDYLPEEVGGYLDAVGSSAYGQGWMGALPNLMMNAATSVDFNGSKVSASDLLNLISGVSGPFTASLNSKDDGDVFNYTVLMSPSQTVDALLDSFAQSNLIVNLMPAICQIAINYVAADSPIDLSGLRFSNIDYSSDITALKDAYQSLYSTGLLDGVDFSTGKVEISFTQEDRAAVLSALKTFGSMRVVSQNMPDLLVASAALVTKSTGYSLLSLDRSKYADIDWGEELNTLGSVAFDLAAAAGVDLSTDLFQPAEDGSTTLIDKIMAGLNKPDSATHLKEALIGDQQGKKGLLDMSIFDRRVLDTDQLNAYLFSSVKGLSNFVDSKQFSSLLNSLNPASLKSDVGIIVDILPDLMGVADLSHEMTGTWNQLKIDFSNEEQVGYLKNVIRKAKDSQIVSDLLPVALNKAFPSLLEQNLGSSNFLGLSATSFDLSGGPEFFDDMVSFLDAVPSILSLTESLKDSGDSAVDKIRNIDPDDFSKVLKTIVNSKVFNPDRVIDGKTASNTNLVTLIRNLIDTYHLSDLGFHLSDEVADIDWDQEVDRLTDILRTLKDHLDVFGADGKFNADKLDSQGIEQVVTAVSRSQLLSPSLPDFLDEQIGERAREFGLLLQFDQITDWVAAATSLGDIWDLVSPLIGRDLTADTPIDFNYLNALIVSAYEAPFIPRKAVDAAGHYYSPLGSFIYSLVGRTGILTSFQIAPDVTAFWDVDPVTGDSKGWNWVGETATQQVTIPVVEKTVTAKVATSGEIFELVEAIQQVQSLDLDKFGQAGGVSADELNNVLMALDDSQIGRSLLPAIAYRGLSNMSDIQIEDGISISFQDINLDVLSTLSDSERRDELKGIVELYRYEVEGDLSHELTVDSLTHWSEATKVTSGSLNADGTPMYLTLKQVVQHIFDIAFKSRLFTTVRSGRKYSFTSELIAALYTVTKAGQVAYGYGSADLPSGSPVPGNIFRDLRVRATALMAEQLAKEETIILNFIEAVQTTDSFDLMEMSKDPASYINAGNIEVVMDQVMVPVLTDLLDSMLVSDAAVGFLNIILNSSGLIDLVEKINSDVDSSLFAQSIDVKSFGLNKAQLQTELAAEVAMFKKLLQISNADSLSNIFVCMVDSFVGDYSTSLVKFQEVRTAIKEVKALAGIRGWLFRGLYRQAKITQTVAGQTIQLDLYTYMIVPERARLGFDETSDPYCVNTVEDLVFNRGKVITDSLG